MKVVFLTSIRQLYRYLWQLLLFIYWTIVIALLMSAIRSKCGSLIAIFGNYYYLSIGQ
ncbi:MAG: hypothetical protein SWX82_19490 [Cyanobacteriota bacterium]|nr:hypothetical protein [Cyanobacteriota bacterium]